jgi:transposase
MTHLPPEVIGAFAPILDMVAHLNQAIRESGRLIAILADTCYPATQRLRQVPGAGPVTAWTFVLTVNDACRFPHGRALGSYFGLRPRQHDSGMARSRLRIRTLT